MRLTHLLPLLASVFADDSSTATAEISTCNPLKASNCQPDPALATSISDDFQKASPHYLPYRFPSKISYSDDGLSLTLAERFDNPSLVSDFYIMFGKVEVWLKSAPGQGVISSFYLQSDDLDEIDLEWFGGDVSQMQSNYFSKGDTTTYSRGGYHNMADPRADFHNYTLDWTTDYVKWYIDGDLVRTLSKDDPQGFPQSPMRLYFGIWAGGDPSNSEGTIEWAGGATDYSKAPFAMHINKLVVADYSTGSNYIYGDNSGKWTSIEATDGQVNGRKSIAEAEFASLVNGKAPSPNSNSNSQTPSSSTSSSSSSTSSSSSVESTISSSSSSSSIESTISSSTTSFEPSTPSSVPTTSSDSFSSYTDDDSEFEDDEITSSTSSSAKPSKTVSLKSEYLTSSTKSMETKTTTKDKKTADDATETTKTTSHSSTSSKASVDVSSNIANVNIHVMPSSFIAVLIFVLCLF